MTPACEGKGKINIFGCTYCLYPMRIKKKQITSHGSNQKDINFLDLGSYVCNEIR